MSKEIKWYSLDQLNETKANYRIAIGGRGNGKTYAYKKQAFDHWLETGKQFAYLRRLAEEIETKRVGNYWNDLNGYMQERLNERFGYDHFYIKTYKGEWQILGFNEDSPSKKENLGTIGYYFALNQSTYDKSVSYPNVDTICYEEFLVGPNQFELKGEFELFLNFISTIKRNRENMVVYMLGNTVNRNNQILAEMNINVRDLHIGQIQRYSYMGENGVENSVAIEYCNPVNQSNESRSFFTFNNQRQDMIVKGQWQVGAYPQFNLDDFYNDILPNIGIILEAEQYRLYCYAVEKNDGIWLYVSPDRLAKRLEYFTLTDKPTIPNFKHYNYTSDLPPARKLIKLISSSMMNNHTLYLDDLTGSDFEHAFVQVYDRSL